MIDRRSKRHGLQSSRQENPGPGLERYSSLNRCGSRLPNCILARGVIKATTLRPDTRPIEAQPKCQKINLQNRGHPHTRRVCRRAKLSENCTLWNRHKRRMSIGARSFFLPAYSPDLNPPYGDCRQSPTGQRIEQVFAKLKHLPRKAAERHKEILWRRIGTLWPAAGFVDTKIRS